MSIGLCLLAFVAVYLAGRRSLALGIVALLGCGYLYGIVRANLLSATYFMFDAALVGLYASQKWSRLSNASQAKTLRGWVLMLILWPALLVMLPSQPLLVSLVGFRAAVFFIPMAVLGSRLRGKDIYQISLGLGALNLVVLGFAAAEYVLGVPRFYPLNASTTMIYNSTDVAGGFFRIPATFVNAHSFGGMMVSSIPYLVGSWDQAKNKKAQLFLLIGTAAALMGVLLSATRLNFVIAAVLVVVAVWNGKMKTSRRAIFLLLIGAMMVVALGNARLSRFKSLSDSDSVGERIAGSVNRSFFEILFNYPLGNGLGGGGTSMPYFLAGEVRNPIGMENSYAAILCEQGVIGFVLWLGFLGWFISRTPAILTGGPCATTRRMIWGLSMIGLFTGMIGMGMLTAIPETVVLLMGIGFIATPLQSEASENGRLRMRQAVLAQRGYRVAPTH